MNKFKSLFFTMLFIVCLAVLTVVVYFLFQGALTEATPSWSPAADGLSSVLGIPAALAGSIVAIYIAYQSFIVSKRQEDFEFLLSIEGVVEDFSNKLWDLAKCFQKLDTMARNGLLDFPAPDTGDFCIETGERANLSPEQRSEIESKLHTSISEMKSVSEDFRDAALNLLRNPIAFRCWEMIGEETHYMRDGRLGELCMESPSGVNVSIDASQISVIAQLFEDLNHSDNARLVHKLLKHASVSGAERNAGGKYTLDNQSRYLSFFGICLGVALKPSYDPVNKPEMGWGVSEIGRWMGGRERRHNSDELNSQFEENSEFHNIGFYTLLRLGLVIRESKTHKAALVENLRARGNDSRHVEKISMEVLEGKNIPEYLPKHIENWVNYGYVNLAHEAGEGSEGKSSVFKRVFSKAA